MEKSSTAGSQWAVKTIGPGLSGEPLLSLDLRHPGQMFAGLISGAYRSTDSGESWTRLSGLVKATLGGTSIDFRASPGNRLTQNLRVQFFENNSWAAPFTAAVEGGSWLTLSAASGATPATLEVRASTAGLAKGSYSANIRIGSPASVTGDHLIPVTLTVTDAFVAPRSYRISTVAGGGNLPPVGAAPAQAKFSLSQGVALDPSGNLVISDIALNQIFRVRNGVLELIAGTGTRGSSGDGGPATAAEFFSPTWIAFGNAGDAYVADTTNFRIRRIDAQGVISAVGTSSRFSLGGMIVDATGNLYSSSGGEIRIRTPAGVDTRFSTGPSIPEQMTRDAAGNLYVVDRSLHQIVRITPGGVSSVVAGTGTAGYSGDGASAVTSQLSNPRGVAMDADGNIFISDDGNDRVRMVDPGGTMFTIAGTGVAGFSGDGGLATQATVNIPYALALDASGNLYLGDGSRVRKLTLIRPIIKANGVTNAASYVPDASPGSLVAIFGDDLANGTDAAKAAPWPTTLGGATVTLNGRLMPLYYVSPGQVNAMVPYETPLGPAILTVNLGSLASASYTVNITSASPGIIAFGDNRAVAVNQDGSINTAANPAKPGSALVIYLIGIGPTNLAIPSGAAAPLDVLARPTGATVVTLGPQTVTPLFLGLTPGSVALAQLNLKLDDNLANGDYAVKVTIAGKESNAPVISVRR